MLVKILISMTTEFTEVPDIDYLPALETLYLTWNINMFFPAFDSTQRCAGQAPQINPLKAGGYIGDARKRRRAGVCVNRCEYRCVGAMRSIINF